MGQQTLVRSVPGELNTDKNEVLRLAQGRGCISKQILTEVRQRAPVNHPSLVSATGDASCHKCIIQHPQG